MAKDRTTSPPEGLDAESFGRVEPLRPRGPEPKVGETRAWGQPADRGPPDSGRHAAVPGRERGPEPRVGDSVLPRPEGVEVAPPSMEKVDRAYPGLYDRSDCRQPREIERFSSPEEWVADRNPGGLGAKGRAVNCGDCARASELTWRGIDTQAGALANPKAGGENTAVMDHWSPGDRVASDFDDIRERLEALGPGSSALVAVWWGETEGHWFNAVNDQGSIRAVDGQSGLSAEWPPTPANLDLPIDRITDVEAIFVSPEGRHLTADDLRKMQ
jgi:hypothetical protein